MREDIDTDLRSSFKYDSVFLIKEIQYGSKDESKVEKRKYYELIPLTANLGMALTAVEMRNMTSWQGPGTLLLHQVQTQNNHIIIKIILQAPRRPRLY